MIIDVLQTRTRLKLYVSQLFTVLKRVFPNGAEALRNDDLPDSRLSEAPLSDALQARARLERNLL